MSKTPPSLMTTVVSYVPLTLDFEVLLFDERNENEIKSHQVPMRSNKTH